MSSRLTPSDKATYAALADTFLPPGAMPSATQARAAGQRIDELLGWRPDLVANLMRAIAKSRQRTPQDALAHLQSDDAEAFDALRLTILGAYLLDPAVMQAIGYTGQPNAPVPPDETPDYLAPNLLAPNLLAPNLLAPNLLAPNLLAPVTARGKIWRDPQPHAKAT